MKKKQKTVSILPAIQKREYRKLLNENKGKTPSFSKSLIIVQHMDLVEGEELTEAQLLTIGSAIKNMLDAPTINSITKEQLRTVIRFLWNNLFEWEDIANDN